MKTSRLAPPYRRLLLLAAIALIAGAGMILLRDVLSFEALRANHDRLDSFRRENFALTVVVFAASYVAIVALSLPGAAVATLTGGFLFGTWAGTAINVSAASLGAVLIFLAARYGAGAALAARIDAGDGRIRKIKAGIDENQWSMLFLLRLVPVVPFFVANLLPAFLGVSLFRFAVSTCLGIVPGALVYTSVGAGLGEVFARGERPDLSLLSEPYVLGPIIGLCLLAIFPMLMRAVLAKKDI